MLLKINNVIVLLAIAVFQIANCHHVNFDSQFAKPLVVPETSFVCWSPLVKHLAHNWNAEFIDQFTLLALKQKDAKWLQWLGLDEAQAEQLFMRIQEIPVYVPTMTPAPIPPASLQTHSIVVENPVVYQPPQALYTWFNQNGERKLIQETQFPGLETASNVNMGYWNNAGSVADPNSASSTSKIDFRPESAQGSSAHFNYNYGSNLQPNINYNIASKSDSQSSTGSKLNAPITSSQFGFNYNLGSSANSKPESVSGFGYNPELKSNTKSDTKFNVQLGSKTTDPIGQAIVTSEWNSNSGFGSSLKDSSDVSSLSGPTLNTENLSPELNIDASESTVAVETATDLSANTDPKNIFLNTQFESSKGSSGSFDIDGKVQSEHGSSKDLNVQVDSSANSDTKLNGFNIKLDSESANLNGKQSSNVDTTALNGFGFDLSANSETQSNAGAKFKKSLKDICTPATIAAAAEATGKLETETSVNGSSGVNGAKSLTASVQFEHEKQGHANGLNILQNLANKVKSKIGEISLASNRNLSWSLNGNGSRKSQVQIADGSMKSVDIDVKHGGAENAGTTSNAKLGTEFEKNLKIETGSSGLKFSSSRNFELGKKSEAGTSGVQSSSGFQFQIPSIFATKNNTESVVETNGSGSGSGFGFNRKFSLNFGRN